MSILAVKEEVRALVEVNTWDENHPEEREIVEAEAKANNETIHIFEGSGICSIKHSELY